MPEATPPPLHVRFGPFRLEQANARLSSDGRDIDIVPKAFGVLCYLAARPGQLVTKDELLDAVWGRRFVSESVLKSAVKTIRACLGDDAQAPRYVQTVQRRGYRFVATVAAEGVASAVAAAAPALPSAAAAPAAPSVPAAPAAAHPPLIGREAALASLTASWARACAGQRCVVLLAGEAGIGKSTLANHFAGQLAGARVGRGQCVDQIGADAAYLPVLEALDGWCADDPGLLDLMRQVAPTWLMQMPWHVPTDQRAELLRELAGAGADRMLREIAELLDRLAAREPLLLLLEDLHWSDAATVQWLDLMARRRGNARIMVLATFRPADVDAPAHPLTNVRSELLLHGLCEELALQGLDGAATAAYLSMRLSGGVVDAALGAALHRHTDGQPLFLARVLDELLAHKELVNIAGHWFIRRREDEALPVPRQLADVIERQLQRLDAPTRQLLQAAALCPGEFEAAVLAEAVAMPGAEAADCLTMLSRKSQWVNAAEGEPGTAGSRASSRFAFGHALFRHVLQAQLLPAQRVTLHQRLGEALEHAHPGQLAERAAELGMHAEAGQQPGRAARFLSQAAAQSMLRFSPKQALALAERGLSLLREGEHDAGAALEQTLHAQRLLALIATLGYAAPATVTAAREALSVIRAQDLASQSLPLWYGCAWIEIYAGHMQPARRIAEELQRRSAEARTPLGAALASNLFGVLAYHADRLEDARLHLEGALSGMDELPAGFERAFFPQNPLLEALAHLGHAQEVLGAFSAAAQSRARLVGLIDSGRHPLSELMGMWFVAYAHHLRGELDPAARMCERALRQMDTHDANPGKGAHLALLAWVCGRLGQPQRCAQLALAAQHEQALQHTRMGQSTMHTCVAGAWAAIDEWARAAEHIDAALRAADDGDNCFGLAETLRLAGELPWRHHRDADAAQAMLDRAVMRASEQGALLFEVHARHGQSCVCDELGLGHEAFDSMHSVLLRLVSDDAAPALPEIRARQLKREGANDRR